MHPGARATIARDLGLALLLGLAGYAIAMGLPLGELRHAVPGDLGDTRFNNYLLEHGWRWLAGDPLHADLWRLPLFFPSRERTFLFSDLLLSVAPPYWALRAVDAAPTDAYVGWLLATSLLNVVAAFVFLRHGMGLSRAASHLGAFLIAYAPYRLHQLPHSQLFAAYLPLFAFAILARHFRLGPEDGRPWLLPLAFAALATQFWGGFYVAYFGCLALGIAAAWALLLAPSRRALLDSWRRHRPVWLTAAALFAATVMPLAALYHSAQEVVGKFGWDAGAAELIARPWTWILMSDRSYLYGWMPSLWPYAGDRQWYELPVGVGFVTSVVAAVGLWRGRASMASRLLMLTLLSIAVVATGIPGAKLSPWRFFYELVPGAGAIRVVGRFGVFVPIVAAVGVGWTLERLWRDRRLVAAFVLGAVCWAEQLVNPIRYDASEDRRWVALLAAQVDPATPAFMANRPDRLSDPHRTQLDAAWAGLAVGKSTVNGYSGSWPPGWGAELWDGINRTEASRQRFEAKLEEWLRRGVVERSSVQVIELPRWYRRNTRRLAAAESAPKGVFEREVEKK